MSVRIVFFTWSGASRHWIVCIRKLFFIVTKEVNPITFFSVIIFVTKIHVFLSFIHNKLVYWMKNKVFWSAILKCENAPSFAVQIEAFAFLFVLAFCVAVFQARHCQPFIFVFVFIIRCTRALVKLLTHCHSLLKLVGEFLSSTNQCSRYLCRCIHNRVYLRLVSQDGGKTHHQNTCSYPNMDELSYFLLKQLS